MINTEVNSTINIFGYFGIGFDTASSIALLAVSALAKKNTDGANIAPADIVILPVSLFLDPHLSGSLWISDSHDLCPVIVHSRDDSRRFTRFNFDALLLRRVPRTFFRPVRTASF